MAVQCIIVSVIGKKVDIGKQYLYAYQEHLEDDQEERLVVTTKGLYF